VLDTLLAEFSIETVLRHVVVPFLREQGERWQSGEIDLLQEHFASNVLRGRLAGLARGWASGSGPRAVIACPEGELHDLAAMVFGITLHRCGWRVIFLGANTPITHLTVSLHDPPAVVVLAATDARRLRAVSPDIATVARWSPVLLAGSGASAELAESVGARYVSGDPVTEAQALARGAYPLVLSPTLNPGPSDSVEVPDPGPSDNFRQPSENGSQRP